MLDEFPSLNEPLRNPPYPRHQNTFFICDFQQNGFKILGENGPKLAHLRLVSSKWREIL